MAKNRYDSLQLIEQIYTYVGWQEFTKHDIPYELRNHLASLSTSGYLKRTRKTKGEHGHNIPVYRIVNKHLPSCVPPLSAIEANTQLTNEPDTV